MFDRSDAPLRVLVSALFVAFVVTNLGYAVAADRITGAIDSANMVELRNHVSPMAKLHSDQGLVEPFRMLRVTILFTPSVQQQRALQKLLAEQQESTSPNYHRWLTPEQYGERFGLSPGDLSKISAWLQAQGFGITYIARGRDFLTFEGSVAQVQSAFRTEVHNYTANGKQHFANATPPMIPAALSGIVSGFRGLHDFFPHPMLRKHPDFTVSGQSTHFIAPGDLATLYDINPLYQLSPPIDGTGQTVVIAGQSDVYLADLNDFRAAFGLTSISGCTMDLTNTIIQAGSCTSGNFEMIVPTTGGTNNDPGVVAGDLAESDLDIEWLGSVARHAKIIFVTSKNGVDDSASFAIDNPQFAPVISYSYGLCEAFITAPAIATAETEYQKASSEGISFFAAAGDSGAAECDGDNGTYPAILGLSVSYPASSPEVTGVGGTEFNEGSGSYWSCTNGSDGGSAKSYIPEIAWNDSSALAALNGTGGGPSNCAFGSATTPVTGPNGGPFPFETCDAPTSGGFPKPSWQSGVTPSDSVRDVPDISFSASNQNDPYIVCTPQSEVNSKSTSSTSTCAVSTTDAISTYNSAFGGTSVAAPIAAGMTVLLNQYTGSSVGPINQKLYTVIYKNNLSVFHDITSGTNSVTGGTSDNVVPCTAGTPSFELTGLRCPSGGTMGYPAGTGYDLVTGLGSLDIDAFVQAWASSQISFTTSATALSPASVVAGNSASSTVTITAQNTYSAAATYSFSCPGVPTGMTCSFSPASVTGSGSTQLTVETAPNMAAGTKSVTVVATSQGNSQSTTLTLAVAQTNQTFTLTPAVATYTVAQGNSVTATINLAGKNGFITPVTYNCSIPTTATGATCTGPSLATAATSVGFQIRTVAPSSALYRPVYRGSRIFYAALLPGVLGILFTAGSSKRSLCGMRMLGLIMVLGVSTMWLGSCGGSNNSSTGTAGTPKGSYTITVNATTGGAVPITGSTTFQLTVQ